MILYQNYNILHIHLSSFAIDQSYNLLTLKVGGGEGGVTFQPLKIGCTLNLWFCSRIVASDFPSFYNL